MNYEHRKLASHLLISPGQADQTQDRTERIDRMRTYWLMAAALAAACGGAQELAAGHIAGVETEATLPPPLPTLDEQPPKAACTQTPAVAEREDPYHPAPFVMGRLKMPACSTGSCENAPRPAVALFRRCDRRIIEYASHKTGGVKPWDMIATDSDGFYLLSAEPGDFTLCVGSISGYLGYRRAAFLPWGACVDVTFDQARPRAAFDWTSDAHGGAWKPLPPPPAPPIPLAG
jgi:hypothetical protein